MNENIRTKLANLRIRAYNEGYAEGKKEGYELAMTELTEVLESKAFQSSQPKRQPVGTTGTLVLEYIAANPGKTVSEYADNLHVSKSLIYNLKHKGFLRTEKRTKGVELSYFTNAWNSGTSE